jgi:serine/threonine protein kinase
MGRSGSIVTPTNKATPHKKPENVKLTINIQSPFQPVRKVTQSPSSGASNSSDSSHPAAIWKVSDAYQVQRHLGEGAFGKVYKAIRRKDNKLVALKVMPKYLTSHEALDREMQALQVFSDPGHDHVCYLYDLHEDEENFYLAMEHIFGGELFEHLVRRGAFSERDAAKFLKEFAEGLAYIHSKGYAHGDLKPENLMMSCDSHNPRVKIVDFGFSAPIANRKLIFGTVAYLSPEILKNFGRPQQPTPAVDMFAVGVIMYTILTGTHPFDRTNQATDQAIMHAVVASISDPDFLSKYVFDNRTEGLSRSSLALMHNLLQPNPKDRMTSTELQQHPWILGHTATHHAMLHSDTKLRRFWQRRFRAAILKKFRVGILSSEEKLKAIYTTMDLNGDGHVSFEELEHALKDIFGLEQMQDIFHSVDMKENGVLDYDEFESIMKTQFETSTTTTTTTTISATPPAAASAVPAARNGSNVSNDSSVRSCILEKFERRASQSISRPELKMIFQAMDVNRNGTVEISDIRIALKENHGVDVEAISEWVSFAARSEDDFVVIVVAAVLLLLL